ncbi:uncharacterized protein CLAFUR5_03296 [Fulvia fulva]|uniref:Uncharacterized protein n=1 Tax=Passalora fulva TaxID=5499 RepID=A0A9Q8P4Z1_PASFU|nr:uncharacterized protein CLAFUR5_03296 [Fulvia fulva]KAK4633198.1 hypothetical protein CLAFUR0_03310 [Fulvia fulva]UJO13364.1 hypothetical protein CLAFUR5_03296 [Fulvia fulva]
MALRSCLCDRLKRQPAVRGFYLPSDTYSEATAKREDRSASQAVATTSSPAPADSHPIASPSALEAIMRQLQQLQGTVNTLQADLDQERMYSDSLKDQIEKVEGSCKQSDQNIKAVQAKAISRQDQQHETLDALQRDIAT